MPIASFHFHSFLHDCRFSLFLTFLHPSAASSEQLPLLIQAVCLRSPKFASAISNIRLIGMTFSATVRTPWARQEPYFRTALRVVLIKRRSLSLPQCGHSLPVATTLFAPTDTSSLGEKRAADRPQTSSLSSRLSSTTAIGVDRISIGCALTTPQHWTSR